MAKTKPQADEPRETQGATSTAKKAKRPSKKQPTKKTAKKPVKKMRVAKKQATKKPAKKSVKKVVAPVQKAKKPAKKAERPAEQEERTVISSPPSRQRRETEKTEAIVAQEQKTREATPQDAQTEEMQWGRRTRRAAPIGREDRVGVTTPVQPTRRQDANAAEQPVEASAEPEAPPKAQTQTPAQNTRDEQPKAQTQTPAQTRKEQPKAQTQTPAQNKRDEQPKAQAQTPAQNTRDEPKKEDTRNMPRPPKGRNQGDQNKQRSSKRTSDRSRSREKKPDQPSNKLTPILAQSWTEDKARQFISEGFLGSLSPELVNDGNRETIPDAEALKKPLEMVRKVLADECMVADDVTDLMLLDLVMNALSDRIDVCRLQAESNALADIDAILELRYKADRRLIEAVNALKNA